MASYMNETPESRIDRIMRQNREIMMRHLEVQRDMENAAKNKAIVTTRVTDNPSEMMPAEREVLLSKPQQRSEKKLFQVRQTQIDARPIPGKANARGPQSWGLKNVQAPGKPLIPLMNINVAFPTEASPKDASFDTDENSDDDLDDLFDGIPIPQLSFPRESNTYDHEQIDYDFKTEYVNEKDPYPRVPVPHFWGKGEESLPANPALAPRPSISHNLISNHVAPEGLAAISHHSTCPSVASSHSSDLHCCDRTGHYPPAPPQCCAKSARCPNSSYTPAEACLAGCCSSIAVPASHRPSIRHHPGGCPSLPHEEAHPHGAHTTLPVDNSLHTLDNVNLGKKTGPLTVEAKLPQEEDEDVMNVMAIDFTKPPPNFKHQLPSPSSTCYGSGRLQASKLDAGLNKAVNEETLRSALQTKSSPPSTFPSLNEMAQLLDMPPPSGNGSSYQPDIDGSYESPSNIDSSYRPPSNGGASYQPLSNNGGHFQHHGDTYDPSSISDSSYRPPSNGGASYQPLSNNGGPFQRSGGSYDPSSISDDSYRPPSNNSASYQPLSNNGGHFQHPSDTYEPSSISDGSYRPPSNNSASYQPLSSHGGHFQLPGDTYEPSSTSGGSYRPPSNSGACYQSPSDNGGSYQPIFSGLASPTNAWVPPPLENEWDVLSNVPYTTGDKDADKKAQLFMDYILEGDKDPKKSRKMSQPDKNSPCDEEPAHNLPDLLCNQTIVREQVLKNQGYRPILGQGASEKRAAKKNLETESPLIVPKTPEKKKKSALQERMEAARRDTSHRFARNSIHSLPLGQLEAAQQVNGYLVRMTGNETLIEPDADSEEDIKQNYEPEEKKQVITKNPIQQFKSSLAARLHHNKAAIFCTDVREKDKLEGTS